MKLPFYSMLLCCILALTGCAVNRSITNLNNDIFFKQPPKIVVIENQYFIRFVYSDSDDARRFAMSTESKVVNNSLIFYLPVTTSSYDMSGRTQFEEIISENKIEIIKNKHVYWEQPDKTLVPLRIEIALQGLEILNNSLTGQKH